MFTRGDDFQYQNAAQNFFSWDRLIKYFNKKHGESIKLMYSTPSCFLKALYQEDKNYRWTLKQDDFFPYADSNAHKYYQFAKSYIYSNKILQFLLLQLLDWILFIKTQS